MYCPFCHYNDTKVIDSRLAGDNLQVRRRRECIKCKSRFSTYEKQELNLPRVIKKNESRESFNEDKVKSGILKAIENRPVSIDSVEQSIKNILNNLRMRGEKEIDAKDIGLLVMQELRKLDQVAYIRFASVYHEFEGLQDFLEIINRLENDLTPEMIKTQLHLIEEEKN